MLLVSVPRNEDRQSVNVLSEGLHILRPSDHLNNGSSRIMHVLDAKAAIETDGS